MADYWKCAHCGGKTFYDANLDWPGCGESRYYEHPKTGQQMPSGAGDAMVLCRQCAETYEVVVQKKSPHSKKGS